MEIFGFDNWEIIITRKKKLRRWVGEIGVPCSLRAVKTMVPVSSPMRHSAMTVGLRLCAEEGLGLCTTVSEDKTLATNVWPLVPGLSWSTLVNTGFLFAGLFPSSWAELDDAIQIDWLVDPNYYHTHSLFSVRLFHKPYPEELPDWCTFFARSIALPFKLKRHVVSTPIVTLTWLCF